jgi:hypothetical protein
MLYLYRDIATLGPDSDGDENTGSIADLRAEVGVLEGRVSAVILGFPHAGVVHTWTQRASWASVFDDVRGYLEECDPEEYDLDDDYGPRRARDAVDAATVRKLADRLAQLPDVRRHGGNNIEAVDDPELAAMVTADRHARWQVGDAIRAILDKERQEFESRIGAQLDQHAATLGSEQNFRTTRTASARRKLASDFLMSLTNGLSLPSSIRDELEARARALRNDTQRMF